MNKTVCASFVLSLCSFSVLGAQSKIEISGDRNSIEFETPTCFYETADLVMVLGDSHWESKSAHLTIRIKNFRSIDKNSKEAALEVKIDHETVGTASLKLSQSEEFHVQSTLKDSNSHCKVNIVRGASEKEVTLSELHCSDLAPIYGFDLEDKAAKKIQTVRLDGSVGCLIEGSADPVPNKTRTQ